MPNTEVDAVFIFELYHGHLVYYKVKGLMLPPSSSLLAAVGFEFTLPASMAKGRTIGVLIPARLLVHISYYADFEIGQLPNCHDAESVIIHPR